MEYKRPIIFELGNVSELTAGGTSNLSETIHVDCYNTKNELITHVFTQPKG